MKCVDAKISAFCRLGKGIDNVAELRGQICGLCKIGIECQLAGTRPRVALTQLTCEELKVRREYKTWPVVLFVGRGGQLLKPQGGPLR